MDAGFVSLSIGLLTFIGGLISLYVARGQRKSQSASLDADAVSKFQESLTKLQERNDELYQENVGLEKRITSIDRTNANLAIRLEERDQQLTAATKQLDLLREMAKTANLTQPLKEQLSAMNQVVINLQSAQAELQKLLLNREQAYKELFDSTRNLNKAKT